jgi:hypothetical protein
MTRKPALCRALLGAVVLVGVAACGSGGSAPPRPAGVASPAARPSPSVLIIDGKKVHDRAAAGAVGRTTARPAGG